MAGTVGPRLRDVSNLPVVPQDERALGLPHWPNSKWATILRRVIQTSLTALVDLFARPLVVEVKAEFPLRRVVFVANHSSHADTAVLMRVLQSSLRSRTSPAAAEDYFFTNKPKSIFMSLLVGAFPFPRRGSSGIERAWLLLDQGQSILLFPEGTRSTDGSMHEFKPGVGLLAARGATIVCVGLAGTAQMWPKGRRIPRRTPVAVVVGRPHRYSVGDDPIQITRDIESLVRGLTVEARGLRSKALNSSPTHRAASAIRKGA